MKLNEAIIIIEHNATLVKCQCEQSKTEAERAICNERLETYKEILKELKFLQSVDFEELTEEIKAEGMYWHKLKEND